MSSSFFASIHRKPIVLRNGQGIFLTKRYHCPRDFLVVLAIAFKDFLYCKT